MSARQRRVRSSVPILVPRIKVWLEHGGNHAFGPGLAEILQAVDRTRSIKQAAAELGRSYRHIWGRIKEAEAAFGQPLVESHVGGAGTHRTTLTPVAQQLTARFLELRVRMFTLLEQEFTRLFDADAPPAAS